MLPIHRGREPRGEHHVAVQRRSVHRKQVRLHAVHPRHERRVDKAWLPLPQQADSHQQWTLHPDRAEQTRQRRGHGDRDVHGKSF